jgi:hypothetical protein
VVPVELVSELLKERMVRIGCHSLDDELPAGNADRERRAVNEESPELPRHCVHGPLEERVSRRIDRVLVHRD